MLPGQRRAAVRHHLNAYDSALNYNPVRAQVRLELTYRTAPSMPVLTSVDPLLAPSRKLSEDEIDDLIQFVRESLLDKRVNVNNLFGLIPQPLPRHAIFH